MVDVELVVTATPDLSAWETGLQTALLSALAPVGEVLRESADSCFETQADPWGNPWPSTARSRAGTGRILIDRVFLRASIHVEIEEATLTVRVAAGGAAAAYAHVHQWGSETNRIAARAYLALRGDPSSPVVDLPPALLAEVVATIQDALDRFVAQQNARTA